MAVIEVMDAVNMADVINMDVNNTAVNTDILVPIIVPTNCHIHRHLRLFCVLMHTQAHTHYICDLQVLCRYQSVAGYCTFIVIIDATVSI